MANRRLAKTSAPLRVAAQRRRGKQMPIVLEHRAAAGRIDDHSIDRGIVEYLAVGLSKLPSGFLLSGMIVEGAAANLPAGNPHFAAVLLQNSGGIPIGF